MSGTKVSPSRSGSQKKMLDAETYMNTQKFGQVMSDFFYATCNEPTVGLWYVQENIRTVVPKIVDTKRKFKTDANTAEICTYGTDFSLTVVKSLKNLTTFADLLQRVRASTVTCDAILRQRSDLKRVPYSPGKGQMGTVIAPPAASAPASVPAPVPAAAEPRPVEEEPKPAAEEPKPVEEEPKPVEEEPKSAEEPKPVEDPKPAEEPKPVETEQKPAEDKPAEAAEEKPATETTETATEVSGDEQLKKAEEASSELGFTPMAF